jgi:hypothetical protein
MNRRGRRGRGPETEEDIVSQWAEQEERKRRQRDEAIRLEREEVMEHHRNYDIGAYVTLTTQLNEKVIKHQLVTVIG